VNFKKWLETATSTSCVAMFMQPAIGMVRRTAGDQLLNEKKPEKKKKKLDVKELDK
jgi:hypothetical protein